MSVLKNAVTSIQIGLEDLAQQTPGRNLSSIRNLHAGVVLLLKARLLELSPPGSDEVLLKQKIKPRISTSGVVEFAGAGRKTVELEEIKQRLSSLGISVDWKRLERLTQERNNIEHYYPQVSDDALRGLAADVLLIVRDFCSLELKRDPRDLLGDKAWNELLQNKEVFDAERQHCINSLSKVSWSSETLREACEDCSCAQCGARLCYVVNLSEDIDSLQMQCRSCSATVGPDEFAERALQEHLAYDRYRMVKDGGTDPLATCPECLLEAFVVDEDACARCGYEREYSECTRCEAELGIEEQEFGGMCSYCDHMINKDD